MTEHELMADAFRGLLTENRYAFRKLRRYLNRFGRPGYIWIAEIEGENIYLVESNTSTGRHIDELVDMVNDGEFDRNISVEYKNRTFGEGRRIEFWSGGVWVEIYWPNVKL